MIIRFAIVLINVFDLELCIRETLIWVSLECLSKYLNILIYQANRDPTDPFC